MKETTRFVLEKHAGPYETWPARTRLLADGRPTRARIPGYVLLRQYALADGWLLVTDCDCPHEEMTSFVLLGSDLRVVSRRSFGAPYGSWLLETMEWIDGRTFDAVFHGGERYRFTIRPRGIPFLLPRLQSRRLSGHPAGPTAPSPSTRP